MTTTRTPTSGSALAELLRKGHSSDPWHGPSTVDLLAEVTPEMAVERPIAEGHSLWEIVLHMTGWQREVARRLEGAEPGMPEGGDWPRPPRPSQAAWTKAQADLHDSLEELAGAVAGLSDEALAERIGSADRPLGTGRSKAETVIGVLQHNAYHSGQIALLLKGLE